jgi:hypothetical protein
MITYDEKKASFFDSYGLLAAHSNEGVGENNILYSLEYFYLLPSGPEKDFTELIIRSALNLMRESKGIYRQHPQKMTGDLAYLSHDQLTAICSFSKCQNLQHHKDLWQEIKRQRFAYCNVSPNDSWWQKVKRGRLLHPRDALYVGYLNDSIICKILSPILFLMLALITYSTWKIRPEWYNLIYYKWKGITNYYKCKIPDMPGKLLNFVRCQGIMPQSKVWQWFFKFVDYRIKKKYSCWNNAFELYFEDKNHPINVASDEI